MDGIFRPEQAVGWLVLEDLLTVFILLLLPALTSTSGGSALPAWIAPGPWLSPPATNRPVP